MNLDKARHNMIEQQIRPWNVFDPRVLKSMDTLPRERFVGGHNIGVAYADVAIPLPNGSHMTPPRIAARMAQALEIHPADKVLEIGTGSGYVTALLASLSSHVYSVEQDEDMIDIARKNLEHAAVQNVTLVQGNGLEGLPGYGSFDVIAVTGSVSQLDDTLLKQLNVGGRLFAITGDGPIMEATLVTRTAQNEWTSQLLFETEEQALDGAAATAEFEF